MYKRDLEHSLRSETSFYFKRLMVSMAVGARDESTNTDINRARADAQELVKAGVKKIGTDESAFMGVLCMQNHHQLRLVFEVCNRREIKVLSVGTCRSTRRLPVATLRRMSDASSQAILNAACLHCAPAHATCPAISHRDFIRR